MLLRIDNLIKEFGKNNNYHKVLDDISIEFKSGEFVCVLGESGSGKSTLLNIIGGLDLKYKGTININNLNLKYIDLDNYRKENIGFVFQNFNLINSLSIIDNILLPIDQYDFSYKEKVNRANELLKKLNIYNIQNKKISDLSGGQKQRVAIARALINDPLIILADEPTGALDEDNSESVLKILKEIQKEGKLVIVVTHSKKVIEYSTRVINIKDGKIISDKRIKRIKETRIDKDIIKENNKLYLIKYGIRNFINNKKRNILISFASSIGIIGIILSLFIGSSIKQYMKELIIDKSNPTVLNIKREDNKKEYSIDDISKIKDIEHVKKIYKEKNYSLSKLNYKDKEYELLYVDSLNKIDTKYGNDKEVVISQFLAQKINKNYKKVLGKNIEITLIDNYKVLKIDAFISGIAKKSNIELVDNSMHAYINYKFLSSNYKTNNIKLNPNNISIKIDNRDNIELVKKKLNKIKLSISYNDELYKELKTYLDIATLVLSFFSSLSLIVSVIMISIIINITVIERIKEIGLLRSIGYTKKSIKSIFKSEASFLGLIIGIISCIISKLLIKVIRNTLKTYYKINISLNPNIYFLFGIILSILLINLAAYFPSKKASNYDPINALKYE